MSTRVERQVIGAGEGAIARRTDERLGAAVFAQVSSQLVGTRETPVAPGDRTEERSFAVVDALVRLEVRTFRVRLETTWRQQNNKTC